MRIGGATLCALLLLSAPGCGAPLSSFQPAHVPEPGKLHAELGIDVSYPSGTFRKVVNAARAVEEASEVRALSDDEKRTILEGGVAVSVDPPAAIPHLGVAYAPWQNWELGLRLTTADARLAVRRQLLVQAESGFDLSVGLGAGRSLLDPPVHSVLDRLRYDDFARWNFDLPVALGRHGSWYRVWGGPRLLYSLVSHDAALTLPIENTTVRGSVSAQGLYFGGYAGAALGYKSMFIGPELTLVRLIGDADVTALGETENVGISSFIVYPGFAVMGEF
jgi:hypothetical protein